ncbi:MAG: hypothetical protein HPY64_13985 [Anaerolineae bacterium]|nr:hypothetical protein [Anaerolineae bacterium]
MGIQRRRQNESQRTACIWLAVALALAFLLMRLPLLTRLPVFVDEGAHIFWAQENLAGGWVDGKWLSIVIMAGFVGGLPLPPLLAARLCAVILSLGSLLLIISIGARLGTRRDGLLAGLIYVLLPYTFFYDRLALTDHSMILFGLLGVLLTLDILHAYRSGGAILLTLALIAAMLAKLTGALYVAVPILGVGILIPVRRWRAVIPRILPALISAAVVYLALRAREFAATQFAEKLAEPAPLANLEQMAEWAWMLLTPPFAIVAVLAAGRAALSRQRADIFLLALLALFILPYVVGAGVLYPRYLLPALGPLIVLCGRFLNATGERITHTLTSRPVRTAVLAGGLALLAAWPLTLNALIAVDPASAPLPERVRWQYITGWPSGTGLDEAARFIQEQAASEPGGVTVLHISSLSSSFLGLRLVLPPSGNVRLEALDPSWPELAAIVQERAAQGRTFLVLSPVAEGAYTIWPGRSLVDLLAQGTLIWEYPKDHGSSLQIWEFRPGS